MATRERTLQFGAVKLAALEFNADAAGEPIVALHGWLDNAMSFAPLAAALGRRVIALDLVGHGHSDWLPPGAWYHLLDNLEIVERALDALELDRATVLGHSMGGAIASLYAGARPGRVEQLVLIEALGPLSYSADAAAAHVQRALGERVAYADKSKRVFASVDDALSARLKVNRIAPEPARGLIERALEPHAGGYRWRSDPRLTVASVYRLTEPQVLNILQAITAPTLFIHATPETDVFKLGSLNQRLSSVQKLTRVALPGDHHLHLDSPESVAQAIAEFLDRA
jgi:pimeloyl-ACP methyl ester carboxylesterase